MREEEVGEANLPRVYRPFRLANNRRFERE